MSEPTKLILRKARASDAAGLEKLYRVVAGVPGGIARTPREVGPEYISAFLNASLKNGLIVVAENAKAGILCGSIHAYRPDPAAFSHILSSLTIVVHPDYQGQGVGRQLFSYFLETIQKAHRDILRIELLVRESNLRGILLYETLGFVREGRLEHRIQRVGGGYEADISMAWLNPRFKAADLRARGGRKKPVGAKLKRGATKVRGART